MSSDKDSFQRYVYALADKLTHASHFMIAVEKASLLITHIVAVEKICNICIPVKPPVNPLKITSKETLGKCRFLQLKPTR